MTIFPDGTKERLHGHNFRMAAAIELPASPSGPMLDFAHVKATLAGLCAELREHLLLPANAPELRILRSDDREIEFELCGARYVAPAPDVLLLPLANVVVEQLSHYLWNRIASALRQELRDAGAIRLELTVTEAPGQGASWSSALPE